MARFLQENSGFGLIFRKKFLPILFLNKKAQKSFLNFVQIFFVKTVEKSDDLIYNNKIK